MREFWIHGCLADETPPPIRDESSWIHVREVRPEYDVAVENLIKALELISNYHSSMSAVVAKEALVQFKQMEDS